MSGRTRADARDARNARLTAGVANRLLSPKKILEFCRENGDPYVPPYAAFKAA